MTRRILLFCCLLIGVIVITASRAQTSIVVINAAKKAQGLQKQLHLSEKQTEGVNAIYKQSVERFDRIKVKENGDTNKMLADITPLRTETINQIKAILTPAQKAKYDRLVEASKKSSFNDGWNNGWSASAD